MEYERKKICFFVPTLAGGGAEKVVVELANEFADRGHSVDLIVCDGDGRVRALVSDDVRLRDLGARRTIAAVPALVRYIARDKPTAIFSALTHANLTLLIASLFSSRRPQIVVSEHNSLSATLAHPNFGKRLYRKWLMAHLYPKADAIVLVSKEMRKQFNASFPAARTKTCTIYNPLDFQSMIEKAKEPVLSESNLPPESFPFILGIGRLTPQKDFHTLLEAFALLRKQEPAKLVILGEGPDAEKLRQKAVDLDIKDDVYWPGFVSNPYPILKRAAVFALSSRWEGLPTVVLEALALGKPVVCTDCPTGPREILEGGKWGQLCPPGEVDAMAAALRRALRDNRFIDSESALVRFDRAEVVRKYLKLLLAERGEFGDVTQAE